MLAVLALGTLLLVAIFFQVPGVNGPWYWHWKWRRLSLSRGLLCFGPPLLAYGYLLRRWTRSPRQLDAASVLLIVTGLVACAVLFQVAGTFCDPRGFALLERIVRSPAVTGYFTDAARVRGVVSWLADFHNTTRTSHSATHPPGPVLYYRLCIEVFGPRCAARLGGILLALISSLGVALVYPLAGLWTADRYARLGPCFVYALLPALVLFFPEFDQLYPLFAMLMLILWDRALRHSLRAAVGLGLAIFAASFMAYNLLTMAVPMALYGCWWLNESRWDRAAVRTAVSAGVASLAVAVGAHALLFAATSFSALGSLHHSLEVQATLAYSLARPYWACAIFDLYDFFVIGGGFVALSLTLLYLLSNSSTDPANARSRALTQIALLSVLIIDLTGLLRCETARVWLFLQPLIIVPAGLQLARLATFDRVLLLTLQALILIALKCNMAFLMR